MFTKQWESWNPKRIAPECESLNTSVWIQESLNAIECGPTQATHAAAHLTTGEDDRCVKIFARGKSGRVVE